jgi:hypothetical protein
VDRPITGHDNQQQQPTNTSGGIRWNVLTYKENENGWIITGKSHTKRARWIDQSPVTTTTTNQYKRGDPMESRNIRGK